MWVRPSEWALERDTKVEIYNYKYLKNNNVIKKLHNHGFLLEQVEDNRYIQNR